MTMPIDVQVQIVTFNSAEHLSTCLESALNQTLEATRILVIDNASTDDSLKEAIQFAPRVETISLTKNTGYAGGHNIGFQEAMAHGMDFVLTLNPDVVLEPEYIERVVTTIRDNPAFGGASGKLLRPEINGSSGRIIDSAGLQMERFFHVRDRGLGQIHSPRYDIPSVVWGTCGAAAVYRIQMLQDVAVKDQVFDEVFFVYKEDVDLAWRANRRGWKFYYEPAAVATHHRGWIKGRKIPRVRTAHSFANQIALLIRHAPRFDGILAITSAVETLRWMAMLIFRPPAALIALCLVMRLWRHHWSMRDLFQKMDVLKVSHSNDLCRPRHI